MADCILVGGGGGGTLSEDVTASKADVLAGKRTVTTDSGDEVVEGTMPNRGAITHSLALNGTYTVPAGYHNGSGKVTQALTVITPTTTNLALNGTYTIPQGWHSGTGKVTQNLTVIAAATHTLAINGTYTIPQGWHNGQGKVTQSITTQGATSYYTTTSAQTISSGRYLTGNLTIGKLSNSNLSAGNIKKGVTINIHNGSTNVWSVTGTWEGYVTNTSSPYNHGVWASGWNLAGCAKPTGTGTYSVANPLSYVQYNATSFRVVCSRTVGLDGWFFYLPIKPMNGINNINLSYIGTWGISNGYPMVLGVIGTKPPNGISRDLGGDGTQINYSEFTKYALSTTISATQETTVSLNISTINNNQYIIFGPKYNGGYDGDYMDITHIWFS